MKKIRSRVLVNSRETKEPRAAQEAIDASKWQIQSNLPTQNYPGANFGLPAYRAPNRELVQQDLVRGPRPEMMINSNPEGDVMPMDEPALGGQIPGDDSHQPPEDTPDELESLRLKVEAMSLRDKARKSLKTRANLHKKLEDKFNDLFAAETDEQKDTAKEEIRKIQADIAEEDHVIQVI